MLACCVGVSAKQFDVLLKVVKQQQQEQKPKLQPVPSLLENLASITPQEVICQLCMRSRSLLTEKPGCCVFVWCLTSKSVV